MAYKVYFTCFFVLGGVCVPKPNAGTAAQRDQDPKVHRNRGGGWVPVDIRIYLTLAQFLLVLIIVRIIGGKEKQVSIIQVQY